DECLGEEQPPRLDRGDEQEFERLALRQLGEPPADEGGPLDEADGQQDLGDGGNAGGVLGPGGDGGQPGEEADVQGGDPAEGELPPGGDRRGGEERREHITSSRPPGSSGRGSTG